MSVAAAQFVVSRVRTDAVQRERILLEHLPQVRYLARRIHGRLPAQVPFEDLVHAGVIGLIDAVDKFDPGKHVQLKSYAKFRIQGAIVDSLREMDWSPRRLRREGRRLEEAHRDLKLRLGRAAAEPELAAYLGMSLKEFQNLLGELHGLDLGSLQTESADSKSEEGARDYSPSGVDKDPFAQCLHREMGSLVASALEDLDQTKKQVVMLYYIEELTMKEVGAELGVSESRVSQIHSAALTCLRARLEELLPVRGRYPSVAPAVSRVSRQQGNASRILLGA